MPSARRLDSRCAEERAILGESAYLTAYSVFVMISLSRSAKYVCYNGVMATQYSTTSAECPRFAALDLLPERVTSAAEAAQALVDISPCPVLTTLPPGTRRRFSRSRYFTSRHIYLNPSEVGANASRLVAGWRGVCILAHEVGHALDFAGTHPLQRDLTGARCRYRNELAASVFRAQVCARWGLGRLATVRRYDSADWRYVCRYVPRPNNPSLEDLLAAAGLEAADRC